jgi:hypothetical protein
MTRDPLATSLSAVCVVWMVTAVTSAGLAPATQPSPPATQPAVPFIYVASQASGQLTAKQKELLLDAARWNRPEGAHEWFVAVVHSGKHSIWAHAFYAPDHSSPRLRKGRYADLHIWRQRTVISGEVVWETKDWEVEYEAVEQYVQVSRPDKPFDQRLEVPASSDIPCGRPTYDKKKVDRKEFERLRDAELVRVVDFARQHLQTVGNHDPICTIRLTNPGVVTVATGAEDWGGFAFDIEEHPDGQYEAIGGGTFSDSLY